jgi:hypothetical protein
MRVPVMDIGIVRVAVPETRVNMRMGVGLARTHSLWMLVLVVLVVEVAMVVHDAFMEVLMLMEFCQV